MQAKSRQVVPTSPPEPEPGMLTDCSYSSSMLQLNA